MLSQSQSSASASSWSSNSRFYSFAIFGPYTHLPIKLARGPLWPTVNASHGQKPPLANTYMGAWVYNLDMIFKSFVDVNTVGHTRSLRPTQFSLEAQDAWMQLARCHHPNL